MKDKEVHGLMKIPSEVLIKELRIELGKANSYIKELEERLDSLGGLKEIKKTHLECLERTIVNLEKKLNKSRKECNEVVEHNLRMQKQLYDLYKIKTDETTSLQRSEVS